MNLNHAAITVLHLILTIVNVVFAVFRTIELSLRHLLAQMGIRGPGATVILILVAILFLVGAIRLFGGVLRTLILVFLLLFALQVVFTIAPI